MRKLERYVLAFTPFTPVLGAARSALALATLLTVAWTPTDQLFFRSTTFPTGTNCGNRTSPLSLFCIGAENDQLELAKWLALVVLAIVASGFLPAVTAIPHWWVSWSLMSSSTAVDGGEHLTANLTLILVLWMLMDRRRWHWSRDVHHHRRSGWAVYGAYACLALWIVQMMGVYFQASVAKFAVLEWSDGTALWYWMQNPTFAPAEPLGAIVRAALQWMPLTIVATYGTLALQLTLVQSVFFPRRVREVALLLAVTFHLVIAVLMGLWSFSMVMIAADLVLLVRPHEARRLVGAFHWPRMSKLGGRHASA
jgi:antimicrobial peptide system SdpB family protein